MKYYIFINKMFLLLLLRNRDQIGVWPVTHGVVVPVLWWGREAIYRTVCLRASHCKLSYQGTRTLSSLLAPQVGVFFILYVSNHLFSAWLLSSRCDIWHFVSDYFCHFTFIYTANCIQFNVLIYTVCSTNKLNVKCHKYSN